MMQAFEKFLIRLLLVASFVSVLLVSSPHEVIVAVVSALVLLIAALGVSRERLDAGFVTFLGAAIPLIPWAGSNLLLIFGLVFLLLRPASSTESRTALRWAAPFLAYLGGAVVGECAAALDLRGAFSSSFLVGVQIDGTARVVDVFRSLCQTHLTSLYMCARAVLFVGVVGLFSSHRQYVSSFRRGFLPAAAVSALFALAQWSGLQTALSNQTNFWTLIRRVSGLMSDPNALGVVMGLAVWCFALAALEKRPKGGVARIAWTSVVICAGVVSGSRSFLLLIGVLVVALTWQARRGLLVLGAVAVMVVVGGVTALDSYGVLVEALNDSSFLPEGIKRGVSALSLSRVDQTFGTRSLFFQIATSIGQGHWLFGIGTDQFRSYVPLIGAQSGLVRSWSDNSNNFYLGLLVETGIVGVLLFTLAAISRIREPARDIRALSGSVLVAIALVLCTGPHVDFPEVLLIVAFLVGSVTSALPLAPRLLRLACVVGVITGVIASFNRERGVYPWSESRDHVTRWLSNRATVELRCEPDLLSPGGAAAQLTLQAMYIPTSEPLRVKAIEAGTERAEYSFSSQERQSVKLPCQPSAQRVLVTLVTRPPWSPYRAWPGRSGDRRLLGLQQIVARAQTSPRYK
jgi:O-antigen ligase